MSTPIEGITGIPLNAGITGIHNTISKITAPGRAEEEEEKTAAAGLDEVRQSSFGSLFSELIQDVKDTDAEFTQGQYLLATGQLDNPAQVTLAGQKAYFAVDLLVQLRNRALDAYNELKNMSV